MESTRIFIVLVITAVSCSAPQAKVDDSNVELWKLGWRMIHSSWDANYQLAEKQFDSLLNVSDNIEYKFLITGLETLHELGKKKKLIAILNEQDADMLLKLCNADLITINLQNVSACENIEVQKVQYPDLQIELIRMYINDQVARGNLMEDLIEKYGFSKDEITNEDAVAVDAENRERLIEIFNEYGFPTKSMVGKDAMNGIFIIIQHSDGDQQWQKGQLQNIENAVKSGDMDGQSYAYLYDRIKINGGEKQLYGTQFANVDPVNKTVTLAETENMDSLDYRRMEVGMMPIDMYKEIMLKSIPD